MTREEFPVSEVSFLTVMGTCNAAGQWAATLRVAQLLSASGSRCSPRAFSELLCATGQGALWESSVEVYRKAVEFDLVTPQLCGRLLEVLIQRGLWKEAVHFAQAPEWGPGLMDDQRLTAIFRALRHTGQWSRAYVFLEYLRENEHRLLPLSSNLFSELCSLSEVTKDLGIALRYSERGIKKNAMTLGALLRVLHGAGKWQDVLRLYGRYARQSNTAVMGFGQDTLLLVLQAMEPPLMWREALQTVESWSGGRSTLGPAVWIALGRLCERSGYTRDSWRWKDSP